MHETINTKSNVTLFGKISIATLSVWATAALACAEWWGIDTLRRWWWLATLFAASLMLSASIWPVRGPATIKSDKKVSLRVWVNLFMATLVWWALAAQHSPQRLVLIVGLSFASFMVGCLVGFLFTSYGQEEATVGKVRDWLVGGLTGLTIAEASNIKSLLGNFAINGSTQEFALVVSVAVLYMGLGFFFMFIERELILNVWLAQSRAERGRLEGTQEAGHVALRLLQALPASVLSGVHEVNEVVEDDEAEKDLRKLLERDDVQKFLDQAEEAATSGAPLDWDVTSKVANLRYYRTYFEKGEEERSAEAERALEWILRALYVNPLHVDLSVKYADMLGVLDRYDEAVSILERIERTVDAPAYVRQWLGYYLIKVDRSDEAIQYSKEYHEQFPDESDTFFNIARAYARKYCNEVASSGQKALPNSENRRYAVENLRKGLRAQPDYAEILRKKWASPDPDDEEWQCLMADPELRSLVGLPAPEGHGTEIPGK
jgi:tetratricopeptide (TPR) repeat protein